MTHTLNRESVKESSEVYTLSKLYIFPKKCIISSDTDSSDNLLILKTSCCRMESIVSSTILKLEQCFLLLSESLTLQLLWNAFCDSGMLWEICTDFS